MRSRHCSLLRFYGTRRCGTSPEALNLVEDRRGDLLLGPPPDLALAVGRHDRDLVLGAVEADVGARDVVHHHRVEPLPAQLRAAALGGSLAVLGREADDGLIRSPAG